MKTFRNSDFLNALAIRQEHSLHVFALRHVTTGGFIPEWTTLSPRKYAAKT
jgi:hypothetical protein